MRALSFLNKFKFSTVDFHRISNFDSDITELRQIVRKFADR